MHDRWLDAVRRADLDRDEGILRRLDHSACAMLGNGIAGACFDFLGGMRDGPAPAGSGMIGMTALILPWHVAPGPFGMDYVVPVGRLQHRFGRLTATAEGARILASYRQTLSMEDGLLRTRAAWDEPGGRVVLEIEQFFPLRLPDGGIAPAFLQRFLLRGGDPLHCGIRFVPVRETPIHYDGRFHTDAPLEREGAANVWRIETGRVATAVALVPDRAPEGRIDDGIEIVLEPGRPLAVALAAHSSPVAPDPAEAAVRDARRLLRWGWDSVAASTRAGWAEEWRQGWIDPGENRFAPAIDAIRTLYATTCAVSPVPGTPPPPVCGLARTAWPSYFPQDFAFVFSNLARFGRRSRAHAMAGWWPRHLDGARAYGRRLLGLDTAYYPWTAPIVSWNDSFHAHGPPNRCYYEHHGQAYVARILDEYVGILGDDTFLRDDAYPVVRDLAETFRAMLRREPGEPTWSARFRPTTSQDEVAPPDPANPFDLLVSAEFTLRLATAWAHRLGVDEGIAAVWAAILGDGLAYRACERGPSLYGAYEHDDRPPGAQKHPVQLNPIALLPMLDRAADPRVIGSWRRRSSLLAGLDEGHASAWSIGELALASARMRDADELAADLDLARRCRLFDEERVQWRESTDSAKSHFLTTPALVTSAIAESLVQDWRGGIEIDPLRRGAGAHWPRLAFGGLRLRGGWRADRGESGDDAAVELLRDQPAGIAVRVPSGPARVDPAPDATGHLGADPVWIWRSTRRIVLWRTG